DNYLPHRPVNEASIRAKALSKYAALVYDWSYTGVNFRDRANSEFYYIEKRIIQNVSFQLFPVKLLTLTLEIKNFTDNLSRDVIGYPLPGRSYYGTVSAKF
ncbi:MAG: TonB-dependent receptor, partial [bacterium]|nr:TonB-dependent receptor [bacterium]